MKTQRQHTSWYEKALPYIYNGIDRINRWRPELNWNAGKMVLCYHSVGNGGWRFSTPVDSFEKQLDYLIERFKVVGLSELLDSGQKGLVSITFDDGYEDVYKNALPILQRRGLAATVFVTGGGVEVDREELDNDLPLMNLGQVKKLSEAGWEIGYHTKHHRNMRALNLSELRQEIVAGKAELEKKLGFGLKYFAYPRGYYSPEVIKLVEQAGFEAGFTIDNKMVEGANPLLLGRLSLEGKLTPKQFGVCVSKVGIWVNERLFGLLKIKDACMSGLAGV